MIRKQIPGWVLGGGAVLAAIAGSINAVGYISVHRQALSHMSGTVTGVGLAWVQGEAALMRHTACVLLAFLLGAFVSGLIVRQSTLRLGRRYGVGLAVESGLLLAAVCFLREDSRIGDYLAAMACGLQNALATSYSGAVVRTTHMTGIVTDLGIALSHGVRGERVDWAQLRLYGVLLTGFLAGSYAGGWGYLQVGYDTLLFPAAVAGLAGVGYAGFKHLERGREARRRTETPEAAVRPEPAEERS